jgi:hypothetical protein
MGRYGYKGPTEEAMGCDPPCEGSPRQLSPREQARKDSLETSYKRRQELYDLADKIAAMFIEKVKIHERRMVFNIITTLLPGGEEL